MLNSISVPVKILKVINLPYIEDVLQAFYPNCKAIDIAAVPYYGKGLFANAVEALLSKGFRTEADEVGLNKTYRYTMPDYRVRIDGVLYHGTADRKLHVLPSGNVFDSIMMKMDGRDIKINQVFIGDTLIGKDIYVEGECVHQFAAELDDFGLVRKSELREGKRTDSYLVESHGDYDVATAVHSGGKAVDHRTTTPIGEGYLRQRWSPETSNIESISLSPNGIDVDMMVTGSGGTVKLRDSKGRFYGVACLQSSKVYIERLFRPEGIYKTNLCIHSDRINSYEDDALLGVPILVYKEKACLKTK